MSKRLQNTETESSNRFGIDLFDLSITRTTAVVVAMIGLDMIWWMLIYTGRVPMPGMIWLGNQGIPMTAPGAMERAVSHLGTLDAVVGYLIMWGVMMWAMMYPVMTRFTREYADAHCGSATAITIAVASFLAGYSTVWMLTGIIPLTFQAVLPGGIYGFTRTHTHLVIGGVLVLAGLYQLSTFKRSRLRTCCARVRPHDAGPLTALREGTIHSVTCILVCFGVFFFLMPFFGAMNFLWMIALATVVIIERLPVTWGEEFAIASGVVAVIAGLIVLLVQPSLPVAFTI